MGNDASVTLAAEFKLHCGQCVGKAEEQCHRRVSGGEGGQREEADSKGSRVRAVTASTRPPSGDANTCLIKVGV